MLVHRQVTPSKHPVIYLGEERHCDCNWSINLIGLISMLKIYTRMVKSKVEMKKKKQMGLRKLEKYPMRNATQNLIKNLMRT